jgi:hypothetical protein
MTCPMYTVINCSHTCKLYNLQVSTEKAHKECMGNYENCLARAQKEAQEKKQFEKQIETEISFPIPPRDSDISSITRFL